MKEVGNDGPVRSKLVIVNVMPSDKSFVYELIN